jgi:hypothetical protein
VVSFISVAGANLPIQRIRQNRRQLIESLTSAHKLYNKASELQEHQPQTLTGAGGRPSTG